MGAFSKDIIKTIRNSIGRFIALLLIVALGSGFYASLQMTGKDMLMTIDNYYDDSCLMDIRVVSYAGLSEDDLSAIIDVEGVESASLAYETDITGSLHNEQITMRVHSMLEKSSINYLTLCEGRLPSNSRECVISNDCVIGFDKNIGDKIEVVECSGDLDSTLAEREFEIVGKVESPLYISFTNPGVSNLGSGQLQEYIYVRDDAFASSYPYSEVYLTVKGAKELGDYSQEYQSKIDDVVSNIEEIGPERVQARADSLREELQRQIEMMSYMQGDANVANDILSEQNAKIDKIEDSEWLVMDRSKIPSVESFRSDAYRVDSIAQVFPLFFFLVAALVALTTMTRMIEEERLNIGTYKALGYSRRMISIKFLVYAFLASAIGATIGILILSQVLPNIIMIAYAIMYRIPESHILNVDFIHFIISFSVGVGVTILVTAIVTWSSVHEVPSSLMRPKVDSAGSKILLERITPLWGRLSFSWKVTLRNLLRYKRRSIMTIIGIGGCCALLLTGYGLSNSINDIIDKQFGETIHYNAILTEKDDVSDEQDEELSFLISDQSQVEHDARVQIKPVVVGKSEHDNQNATLVVPQDFDELNDVWTIRERLSRQDLILGEDDVLICEKLSGLYDLKGGDEIEIFEQDEMGNATNHSIKAKVGGIFENYVANYIIAPASIYTKLFEQNKISYSSYYAKLANDGQNREEFANLARESGAIKTIAYNDEAITTYRNALKSVDMVVVVLVVCAAILASIVLYNLNNINICERRREIATLQVLGFNDREVQFYIYRETIILTILGCIVGLIFGVFLEGFVVVSAEVDQVMFGREIHLLSYLLASGITLIFSVIIMFLMRRKFSSINMVESLKSAE